MRQQIEAALASPALRTKGARALLEALRDCERGGSVVREEARAALAEARGQAGLGRGVRPAAETAERRIEAGEPAVPDRLRSGER